MPAAMIGPNARANMFLPPIVFAPGFLGTSNATLRQYLAQNRPTKRVITVKKNRLWLRGSLAPGWWYSLKQTRILWYQVHEYLSSMLQSDPKWRGVVSLSSIRYYFEVLDSICQFDRHRQLGKS